MKSGITLSSSKLLASAFIFALFSLGTIVSGQGIPQINTRFTNPEFDKSTKLYYLDVELKSTDSKEFLFGMNVRFFYDASLLDFKKFDQFSPGYGTLGQQPITIQANGQSGIQMFNLNQATVFVNGAVQLGDNQTPLEITPEQWVKAFRVCFKVAAISQGKKDFCPSVLWDLKPIPGNGGFLAGDDGLVITVVENDPNTPDVSAPTKVTGFNFNWEPTPTDIMPYGKPVASNCISLSKINPAEGNEPVIQSKYALFQNEPNPFDSRTSVTFILPSPQQVTFIFYDISGKVLSEIKGDYAAGKNTLNIEHQPWMEQSKVVFYLMETEGFRSEMFRMTIINR